MAKGAWIDPFGDAALYRSPKAEDAVAEAHRRRCSYPSCCNGPLATRTAPRMDFPLWGVRNLRIELAAVAVIEQREQGEAARRSAERQRQREA